ncbi:hypothetical protein ACFHW1_28440 [Micromonospora sp. LOL_014]|uniref:hypothetical protein n=1 Tax=Micromonospora sp. LOL_014 TaxID=3345415 RepID=UPI003A8A1787
MNFVTRALIESVNWAALRADSGNGGGIPRALNDLWEASSEDEARRAYWQIDNEAVVQGQLYESAVPTLQALLSMASVIPSGPRRRAVAELIQQIVFGQPHSLENAEENVDIVARCSHLAMGAVWLFYGWLTDDDSEVRELALLILQKVEDDDQRKFMIFSACRNKDSSPGVQAALAEIDRGLH